MRDTEENNYFTAGELAALFGISKQTLLYYDKIKLLSPDFISANGYRHYSIDQYLLLEIIVNMRMLDISIADIKEYLASRSREDFLRQMQKKEAECLKIIQENERICHSLGKIKSSLESNRLLPLEQINVCWREERLLRLTVLSAKDDGKARICKFARHSQATAHHTGFPEKHTGWILTQEDFFLLRRYNRSQAYFSFSDTPPGHGKNPRTPLPKGLYLEIYFSGPFYTQAEELRKRILGFMKSNDFSVCSDIYIVPIENHWLCEDTNEYINLLFLQVQPAPPAAD